MTTPALATGKLSDPVSVLVDANTVRQVCPAVGGSVLIYNPDANNTVYVGYNRNTLAPSNSVPVLPQTPVVINGERTIWGFSPMGPVTLSVVPGGIYQGPGPLQIVNQIISSTLPSLIAAAVQAAGVPPIDIPAIVYINLGQDLPVSPGTFTTGHINMSKYQSYSMIVKVGNGHNNVNTIPYVRVTFQWSLAADNFDPIHIEDWILPVGPFSFTFNYNNYGAGPCYSDTLEVIFHSYDTVIDTMIMGIFGSFRTRNRSVLRGQYNFLGGGGVNEPAGLETDAILASVSGTNLAVGASTTPQLVGLWHGGASLYLQSADAALDDLECHIQPQPASVLTNSPDIVLTMDGSGNFTRLTNIILPRRVCTIFFKNTGQVVIPSFSANLVMEGVSE